MGEKFIQYILAHKWLISESLAPCYTEKIACLPNACFSALLEKSDRIFTKADFGFDADTDDFEKIKENWFHAKKKDYGYEERDKE